MWQIVEPSVASVRLGIMERAAEPVRFDGGSGVLPTFDSVVLVVPFAHRDLLGCCS